MLYEYENKLYIKPLANKIVEVTISKKDNEYDVKPTKNSLSIDKQITSKLVYISLEQAYKKFNKTKSDLLNKE